MSQLFRITSDPEVCGGRPCIRRLRVRVTDVLEMLASGMTHAEIVRDYEYLEPEDIVAVLEYAAVRADHVILRAA